MNKNKPLDQVRSTGVNAPNWTSKLVNRVFSRMFQLLCSFYSRNVLYISKMPSTKSLIFELNFTMFSTLFYYTESLMYIRNLWLFTHDF